MKEAKSFLILSHGESLPDLKLSLEHWKGKSSRQMFGYLLFLSSLLHGMNRQKTKMKQVHREVTKGWNEVVWNEVVMERSDRIPSILLVWDGDKIHTLHRFKTSIELYKS